MARLVAKQDREFKRTSEIYERFVRKVAKELINQAHQRRNDHARRHRKVLERGRNPVVQREG